MARPHRQSVPASRRIRVLALERLRHVRADEVDLRACGGALVHHSVRVYERGRRFQRYGAGEGEPDLLLGELRGVRGGEERVSRGGGSRTMIGSTKYSFRGAAV